TWFTALSRIGLALSRSIAPLPSANLLSGGHRASHSQGKEGAESEESHERSTGPPAHITDFIHSKHSSPPAMDFAKEEPSRPVRCRPEAIQTGPGMLPYPQVHPRKRGGQANRQDTTPQSNTLNASAPATSWPLGHGRKKLPPG